MNSHAPEFHEYDRLERTARERAGQFPIAARLGELLRAQKNRTDLDDYWALDLSYRGEFGPDLNAQEQAEVKARLRALDVDETVIEGTR